jgi:hypothetical protein
VLLVEDVVSLKQSNFDVLRNLLVFRARHREVDVFMASEIALA